jgi:hypothetical protein
MTGSGVLVKPENPSENVTKQEFLNRQKMIRTMTTSGVPVQLLTTFKLFTIEIDCSKAV